LECGRSSYRLPISPHTTMVPSRDAKAVAAATALQGASRIFILSDEPKAHGRLCGMAPPFRADTPYSRFWPRGYASTGDRGPAQEAQPERLGTLGGSHERPPMCRLEMTG